MQITINNNTGVSFDLGIRHTIRSFQFAPENPRRVYVQDLATLEYSIEKTIVVERKISLADAVVCVLLGDPNCEDVRNEMGELQRECGRAKKPLAFISPLWGVRLEGFQILAVLKFPYSIMDVTTRPENYQTPEEWADEFEQMYQSTVDRLSKQVTPREYPRRGYRMAFSWP